MNPLPIQQSRRTLLDAIYILAGALLVLLLSLFLSNAKPTIYDINIALVFIIAMERVSYARWMLAYPHV